MFRRLLATSTRNIRCTPVNNVQNVHVTLIPGDGIGPEVMEATKELIYGINAPVIFDEHRISEITGTTPEQLDNCVESLKETRVCLKGFVLASRKFDQNKMMSLQMILRKKLCVFANVSHIHSYDGIKTRYNNLDFIVIRETTEGEYCGTEHQVDATKGRIVESLKVMTAKKSLRIARFAFDYAIRHGRKKVTVVHKANIMKMGDGLFRKSCAEVSKDYPSIEYEEMIVDNTCMQLVSNPYQFDVLVMPNLYGNIIENLGAGLIGGAGVLAGASYSNDIAFFGAGARYTFNSGAGRDICNPTAMFIAAGNMLGHVGLGSYGACIKDAVRRTIAAKKEVTRDIGGQSLCTEFTGEVINNIKPVSNYYAYNYK